MVPTLRQIPELVFAAIAVCAQWKLSRWALESPRLQRSGRSRKAVGFLTVVATAWLAVSFLYLVPVLDFHFSRIWWMEWVTGLSLVWGICVIGLFLVALLCRRMPRFDPRRRRLLRVAGTALFAGPFAVAGFGVLVERKRFRVREIDVPVKKLPADLEGLRLVQLSDIHLSSFLEERDLERVVDMANETRAHVAVVTGDLITMRDALLTNCLQRLKNLRAEAGVLGSLGNHEIVAGCEERVKREGAHFGIDFLRGEVRQLRFGTATLNIAGVDYQPRNRPYLKGAGKLVRPGAVNVLLCHNPDVFPVAARQGYDLTLAGHTHGGQVSVQVFRRRLSLVRFFTPYVYGLYRQGSSSIYVTRGIGTVGIPVRIGAPPEIALIRLCAT